MFIARIYLTLQKLGVGANDGKRCLELVAGVGDKFLLGIDHLLDRVGQPAGECPAGDGKEEHSDEQQSGTGIDGRKRCAQRGRTADQNEIAFAGAVLVFI